MIVQPIRYLEILLLVNSKLGAVRTLPFQVVKPILTATWNELLPEDLCIADTFCVFFLF